MIKKYSLVFVAFLCFVLSGFGQSIFTNLITATNPSTANPFIAGQTVATNLVVSGIGRGSGIVANAGSNRYNASSWNTAAIDLTAYFEFTLTPNTGFEIDFVSFVYTSERNNVTITNFALRSSVDGFVSDIGTPTFNGASIDLSSFQDINGSITFRFYAWGADTVGRTFSINDFTFNGLVASTSTNTIDYCNLQFPQSGNTTVGTVFDVYAQVREAGVTNLAGADSSIAGWIGYNTVNNNPSTTGWTWIPATFNTQVNANDDEYVANIGTLPTLPSGTYYYASRFQINGGPYRYGGYNAGGGGFWNTSTNVSGILSVDTPDFVNLQFPGVGTIELGDAFDVYGQVYEQGVTPGAGQGLNIESQIGYLLGGATNTNPSGAGWTWQAAAYNASCSDCNVVAGVAQNDEYSANIGSALNVPGTYSYATRFRINGGIWLYGGILADGSAGSFWNGTTYRNGMLTVNEPPLANVVITEIMYDTTGTDDEWIELCNVSGSSQYLGGYRVKFNSTTLFTFPAATYIANGTCITVSVGSNGDGIYNIDCPFTPTYGIGANTNSTNKLTNGVGPYTISLVATNGTSIIDSVSYSNVNGADGNGASLHVTNIALDNSNTSSNWQEVINGGTAGANSLVSSCTPVAPEIRVEGNLGTFPEIVNGDTTPQGTDNTLFAAQFIGSTQAKTYRVRNTGILNLTVSSVSIGGLNPGDFTVTVTPATTITPGNFSLLEIEFSPLLSGIRRATVSIVNNDSDENPYTFDIQGNGLCVGSTNTINPVSGPTGTVVTITGTDFGGSTTATINGISMTKTIINATTMEVTVPSGAATGNIVIVNSIGCTSNIAFTVIDNQIGGCEGGASLSDLIISEVTDATVGGVSYVEIYNGTGASKNLGGYSIGIYSNGEASPSNSVNLNAVNLANNATYVVAIGVTGSPSAFNTCPQTGGNGQLASQTSAVGGINKKDNEHDAIRLLKSSGTVVVDEFGVYMNPNWMDATIVTGDRGFNFRRLNTASPLPNPTFNINNWNVIDWVGSGSGSCGTNDYSNIGIFDFSSGTAPSVTLQPIAPISNCDLTATLTIQGAEGYDAVGDTQNLTYQWFYNVPNTTAWVEILSTNTAYSGQQSPSLTILNTLNLDKYQYYAQVRESGVTCFKASNAVRLKVEKTTWNGTTWTPIAPTINTIAVLADNYDTANGGVETSFEACNLIINTGIVLRISDVDNGSVTNTYVKVQNNILNSGEIYVDSKAALVQVEDDGIITLNTAAAKNTLSKFTHPLQFWYDYTYWSSPLEDAQIENALFTANANRRFLFVASQFNDTLIEIGNTGTFNPGSDDIDDEGNDWLNQPTGSMIPGVGYAATHSNNGFISGIPYQYIFEGTLASGGAFNTGNISVPIYINPSVVYNNWNFIGNPYPSAISALKFFEDTETFLEGVIYLWSQSTNANSNASGNQAQNFSQDDYAMINYVGGIAGGAAAPSDTSGSNIPNPFVPSGQGFFVIGKKAAVGSASTIPIVFNNAMRDTGNNTQFFRTSETAEINNKLWIDLTSDNGVFNQVLVGYLAGATDAYDGMHYDAPKNLSTGTKSILYLNIPSSDKKYAIQGKNSNSLTLDEVIPLGFYTAIAVPTIYKFSIAQFEGDFFSANHIYLKDNLLNSIHNLSSGDYMFTSEIGKFDTRFEIVFREQALSVIENEISANGLTIIELPNGQVKFSVGDNLEIQSVEIIDMLGRTLYNLKGNSPSEIYELSNLSQAAYIAKVKLSNGQVITKRAVKRY